MKGTDPPLGGLQSVSSLLIILQRWLLWRLSSVGSQDPTVGLNTEWPPGGNQRDGWQCCYSRLLRAASLVRPTFPQARVKPGRGRRCCEYIEIIGQTLGMQVLTQQHHSPFCAAWTTLIGMLLRWHPPQSLLTKHMVCEHKSVDEYFPLKLTRTSLQWLSSSSFPPIFCVFHVLKEPKWWVQIATTWYFNN